jgi:hypothetical protein
VYPIPEESGELVLDTSENRDGTAEVTVETGEKKRSLLNRGNPKTSLPPPVSSIPIISCLPHPAATTLEQNQINLYAELKAAAEQSLSDASIKHDFTDTALRMSTNHGWSPAYRSIWW